MRPLEQSEVEGSLGGEVEGAQLRTLIDAHYDFTWRSLRRLGVPESSVEDAAQQVWLVVARRLPSIAVGTERTFLFATAMRIAANARRSLRRRERVIAGGELSESIDPAPLPDEALAAKRERAQLDLVLDTLPLDLRATLVLFELEELSTAQIAELLGIPLGTVASRLRRAREAFAASVVRLRARGDLDGGLT